MYQGGAMTVGDIIPGAGETSAAKLNPVVTEDEAQQVHNAVTGKVDKSELWTIAVLFGLLLVISRYL